MKTRSEFSHSMTFNPQIPLTTHFLTPYRWGYGWPFGRMYEPLSADEEAQVSEL
jgi:hypothetical protein